MEFQEELNFYKYIKMSGDLGYNSISSRKKEEIIWQYYI